MNSTNTDTLPTVYLSSSLADRPAIEPVCQWLQAQGLTAELATEPLDSSAIGLAQVFVYYLSATSAESTLCKQALDAALAADLPILLINPLQLDIPELLRDPLRYAHPVDSGGDLNQSLYSEIAKHLPPDREPPLSKPAMPDFPENQRASLIQHGVVALVILLLGLITYFLFRP